MDEFTGPTPMVSNAVRAADLIQEAKAIDAMMRDTIRVTADQMVMRGNCLIKAKQLCGKGGPWRELLKKVGWSERSAYRYMAQATEKARSATVAEFEGHTHKVLDGNIDDENNSEGDDEIPALTEKQRRILMRIIGYVKPSLSKKLLDGSKTMSDAELEKECPPHCHNCGRGIWPSLGRPCEACEKIRKGEQQTLFEEGQEPADPDNPESTPKPPPPNPLIEATKLATKASGTITAALNTGEAALVRAFNACGLVEWKGEKVKFLPWAGVKRVIDRVLTGEPFTDEEIVIEYRKGCGTWLPEKTRWRRNFKKGPK